MHKPKNTDIPYCEMHASFIQYLASHNKKMEKHSAPIWTAIQPYILDGKQFSLHREAHAPTAYFYYYHSTNNEIYCIWKTM